MAEEREPTVLPSSDDREVTDASPDPVIVQTPIDIRSIAVTVLAVFAAILMLRWAESVLIPIVLAILISYVLGPIVTSMANRGIPRALGAFLAIVAICGGVGYGVYTLSDEAVAIIDDLPLAARKVRDRLAAKGRPQDAGIIEKMQDAAAQIDRTAADAQAESPTPAPKGVQRVQVIPPPFRASEYLWLGGQNLLNFLGQFAIVLFLVYFLLVTDDLYKRKMVKIAGPTLTKKKISVQIMDEINQQISAFLRVQVLTSALVGVATGVALWAFGVDNYVIWGLLAGIFNSIPYLGPIVVSAGLAVVTFLQFDDLLITAYVAGTAMAITSLEGWLLTPLLMSRAAQMNPVAIFVGLLFWSWVWGVWGTILAVPMLMTVKAICDRVEDLQPVGEMLGE
jgi:predicted PurR-regulated permease PerM